MHAVFVVDTFDEKNKLWIVIYALMKIWVRNKKNQIIRRMPFCDPRRNAWNFLCVCLSKNFNQITNSTFMINIIWTELRYVLYLPFLHSSNPWYSFINFANHISLKKSSSTILQKRLAQWKINKRFVWKSIVEYEFSFVVAKLFSEIFLKSLPRTSTHCAVHEVVLLLYAFKFKIKISAIVSCSLKSNRAVAITVYLSDYKLITLLARQLSWFTFILIYRTA